MSPRWTMIHKLLGPLAAHDVKSQRYFVPSGISKLCPKVYFQREPGGGGKTLFVTRCRFLSVYSQDQLVCRAPAREGHLPLCTRGRCDEELKPEEMCNY